MIGKYFDGRLPEPLPADDPDYLLLRQSNWVGDYMRHFRVLELTRAGEAALQPVRDVDSFIEQTQPFRMAKDETKLPAVGAVLYQCTEALRIASVLLWPFVPDACELFWQRIGCDAYADMLANNGSGDWEQLTARGQLLPGTPH